MIQHGICCRAKAEIMAGLHPLSDRFMLALYAPGAELSRMTEAYMTAGEARGRGYRQGGVPVSGLRTWADEMGNAYMTFDNVIIPNCSITAQGALLYNATKGGRAIAVIDLGNQFTSTAGKFELITPADLIGWMAS